MKIRKAARADLPFIVAANAALASETEGQTLDGALLGPGVQAVLDNPRHGRCYSAEVDGQAIGQLMTTYEWSDRRNGHFLWIQSVYVQPAHRSGGVFRALYGHLEALARRDYGIMEAVYRGPESHEEAPPC